MRREFARVSWLESFNVVRDIMLILSALALVTMAVFGLWALWQLYRLGRELRAELQPILDSVQGTTESVRGMASFVDRQLVSPATGAISLGLGARGLLKTAGRFYAELSRDGGAPAAGAPEGPAGLADDAFERSILASGPDAGSED